jgi:ABC-type polysaccharide/polyol phosphate export permease
MATISDQSMLPIYDSSRRRNPLLSDLADLVAYRDLLRLLIRRNIVTRYKRSVLGIAWTMLNPLLMMMAMALVFSQIFTSAVRYYPIYILTGLLLWSFFSQTSTAVMTELLWGGSVLQRIYVPRTIFAFSALGTGLVNFVLSLVPLLLLMIVFGAPLTAALFWLPAAMALVALFALGLGLFLSTLAVQFGDVVEMYGFLLTPWLYLTPIIYPIDIIPAENRWLFLLNPMYYFVEVFRAPIRDGQLPDPSLILVAAALAVSSLLGGLWFFLRKVDDLVSRL